MSGQSVKAYDCRRSHMCTCDSVACQRPYFVLYLAVGVHVEILAVVTV